MTWLKISNSTELNQFQTDDIVFIHADGNYSDIALVNGTATRLGYCAMADGRMVIGVSRSERVMDYVKERGGSFFRQFILVSDGVLPKTFYLHGKVERRAIGRMPDGTRHIIGDTAKVHEVRPSAKAPWLVFKR